MDRKYAIKITCQLDWLFLSLTRSLVISQANEFHLILMQLILKTSTNINAVDMVEFHLLVFLAIRTTLTRITK